MAYDRVFGDWVRDHLRDLGPIEIKPMFGAAGVKFGGAMFAGLISLLRSRSCSPDIFLSSGTVSVRRVEAPGAIFTLSIVS